MRWGTTGVVALCAAALAPAGAQAATVTLETAVVDEPYPQEATVVRYEAAAAPARKWRRLMWGTNARDASNWRSARHISVGATEIGVVSGARGRYPSAYV